MTNNYKGIGDKINATCLVASIVYLVASVYYTLPGVQGFVDEYWKKDGFCIQNNDVPYWSSFDTCLYVDVLFSIIIGIMYISWRDTPGMEISNEGVPNLIVATLAHGMVHGSMASELRQGTYQTGDELTFLGGQTLWMELVWVAIFWIPLLKIAMPKVGYNYLVLMAGIVHCGSHFIKKELSFPYVQTIVNVGFHVSQLMQSPDEKNRREYKTMSVAFVPPLLAAYSEMLFCDAFYRSLGGHVIYDASIVLAFCVSYTDSYFFHTKSTKEKSA